MTASMDDLTDRVAPIPERTAAPNIMGPITSTRIAVNVLAEAQAFLRERGVLLGPDGLIQAERVGTKVRVDGRWWLSSNVDVSGPGRHAPLFTHAPVDPPGGPVTSDGKVRSTHRGHALLIRDGLANCAKCGRTLDADRVLISIPWCDVILVDPPEDQ